MADDAPTADDRSADARHEEPRGPIAWMTRNHVAANLLMALFILGGLAMATQVKQEVFPEFEIDRISVSVPYPGASPEEVEQGILLSIEDAVRGLDGVKEVTSVASEGAGSVSIELLVTADRGKALQDVKNAIDRIRSFPEEAERPTVSIAQVRNRVISLFVSGDVHPRTLRELAEGIRDDLIGLDGITLVELGPVPRLEIAIEVPDRELRALGLTLEDVARTVRQTAVELPAGAVKTDGGEVLLRTQERRDFGLEFADIPIATTPEGTRVLLGDVARIVDGFEDTDQETLFGGRPAVRVDVYRVGDETPISVSDVVNDYVAEAAPTLPPAIELATWDDRSVIYRERMQLLLKNAFIGLVLVLLLLGLFLEPRLAFWVTLGIPISILGSFLFLPFTGASINMISLFAFIITLGIIVDDAVVMGENIFARREEGMSTLRAAMLGAKEIAPPITFAVLTNIAAFMPLMFVPGSSGNLFGQIPAVTIAVFVVSLVESIFILPSHLSHRGADTLFWRIAGWPSRVFGAGLEWVIRRVYEPSLRVLLAWRYATVAGGIGMLILCGAAVGAGMVPFSFLPRIDTDTVTVRATLPFGVPVEQSREVQARLMATAREVIAEVAEEEGTEPDRLVEGMVATIGSFPQGGGPGSAPSFGGGGAHLVGLQVALVPSGDREIGGVAFAERWRRATGPIPGLESLVFDAQIGAGGGEPIEVELSHRDTAILDRAAAELAVTLGTYAGVIDIDDGVAEGKPQLDFTIRPEARSLGITASEIATQLRGAFFGIEALRQQRGRNEVRVMVRLPEAERETLATLDELMLRPRGGGELPLREAVEVVEGRSYTEIRRVDGRRTKAVSADVEDDVANAEEVLADLQATGELDALVARYPGLTWRLAGEQDERRDSLGSLAVGFPLAMLVIYALLAVPFRSYVQPFLVMAAIPFGAIGAVLGHILLDFGLSIMSMFGIIALAGVVVNDSLVLVYTANRLRRRADAAGGKGLTAEQAAHGLGPFDAVVEAGTRRFRPILLTSLTTFFGLAPIIFETSVQARFLIPMAISLGFGILFATAIILVLLPALYLVLEDVLGAGRRFVELGDRPRGAGGADAAVGASGASGGDDGGGGGDGGSAGATGGRGMPAAGVARSPRSD